MRLRFLVVTAVSLAACGCVTAQSTYPDMVNAGDAAMANRQYASALRSYMKAAERDDSWGELNVAKIHENGQGVAKDDAVAAEWYAKSANHGNPWAMNGLGSLYEEGRGVPKDLAKAADFYARSASQGNPWGLYNQARALENDFAGQKDPAKSLALYQKAATLGNSWAQYTLGDSGSSAVQQQGLRCKAGTVDAAASGARQIWSARINGRSSHSLWDAFSVTRHRSGPFTGQARPSAWTHHPLPSGRSW